MAVYILIGIDPLAQPGVHSIFKYTTLKESHDHVAAWLHDTLTLQSRLLCGLKGIDVGKNRLELIVLLPE